MKLTMNSNFKNVKTTKILIEIMKVKPCRRQGPSTTRRNLTQNQLNAFKAMLSSSLKENNLKQSILGLQKYRSQSTKSNQNLEFVSRFLEYIYNKSS